MLKLDFLGVICAAGPSFLCVLSSRRRFVGDVPCVLTSPVANLRFLSSDPSTLFRFATFSRRDATFTVHDGASLAESSSSDEAVKSQNERLVSLDFVVATDLSLLVDPVREDLVPYVMRRDRGRFRDD